MRYKISIFLQLHTHTYTNSLKQLEFDAEKLELKFLEEKKKDWYLFEVSKIYLKGIDAKCILILKIKLMNSDVIECSKIEKCVISLFWWRVFFVQI